MTKKSTKKTSAGAESPLISNAKLQQMYTAMLKCRILDSHARSFGDESSWRGKEAAAVGATIDLQPEDAIVFPSGVVVASFLKGTPLRSILHRSQAHSSNGFKGKGKSLAGSGMPPQSALATGIAYARHATGKGQVTVAFLSENPEKYAAGLDALHFASKHKLPILYICSGEAMNVTRMNGLSFPVIPVDGSDVVAVYRVAHECTTRARQGGGPSLIACTSFSVNGNAGKGQNPLRNMEHYLSEKGLFSTARKQSMIRTFEEALGKAKATRTKLSPHRKNGHESKHLFIT